MEEPQILFHLKIKVNAKNVSYVNKILQCTVCSYYITLELPSYVLIERLSSFSAALKVCLHSVETSYNNTPQRMTVSFSAAVTQGDYFLDFLQIVEQHFYKQRAAEQSYTSLAIAVINSSLHSALKISDCAKLPRKQDLLSDI